MTETLSGKACWEVRGNSEQVVSLAFFFFFFFTLYSRVFFPSVVWLQSPCLTSLSPSVFVPPNYIYHEYIYDMIIKDCGCGFTLRDHDEEQ